MMKLIPFYPNNSLFQAEIRSIRWADNPQHLRRSGWMILVIVTAVVSGLVIVYLSGQITALPDQASAFFSSMILLGIMFSLLVDFTCLLFTLTSHPSRYQTLLWEMVQLSPSGLREVIEARYAVAHIRAWQVSLLLVAFRLSTIITAVVYFATRYAGLNAADTALLILIFGLFALVYVIEPLWRIQAVTAIGLRESISSRTGTTMLLRAGIAVLSMTLFQLLLGAVLIFIGQIITLIFHALGFPLLGTLLMIGGLAVLLYVFYGFLGLNNIRRWLRALKTVG